MRYDYPEYSVDITPETVSKCRDVAQRLLAEVGLRVDHERFVSAIRGHDGVRVEGDRVYLSRKLTDRYYEAYIARNRAACEERLGLSEEPEWRLSSDGFSISVIDIETDKVRPATSRDLRELIRLIHSFGMTGSYPCTPQDVPPLMRAPACFKICWEESDRIRPFDYLDVRQTPFLYEMHRVMGKPFVVNVNIPHAMTVSEQDIEVFLRYYPAWKRDRNAVSWYTICDYPMLGVSKPITSTGAVGDQHAAQAFGGDTGGFEADVLGVRFSPRASLRLSQQSRFARAVRVEPGGVRASERGAAHEFVRGGRSSGHGEDTALVSAMQGARIFGGAGNLAVDDLFSGVQLVVDVEIFEYVKEVIESFDPHPDIVTTEGLYEVLHDVATGREEFYSHPDTAARVRELLPVSNLDDARQEYEGFDPRGMPGANPQPTAVRAGRGEAEGAGEDLPGR